jgi:predicted TIM-barrel enzyme
MSRYRTVFPQRHVVLPVIHVESTDQALRNASIARGAGCAGVFLINHDMPFTELLDIHQSVSSEFPGWWIGVNLLDLPPEEVFRELGEEVSGVWVDNARIDERYEPQAEAEMIEAARVKSGWSGLYFGGVAFKYQRPVQDLARAARLAMDYMDVVTTSGPGTGQAAPRQKIQAMRQALGDFPLAIASGIAPANVHEVLDLADCFLVATGISRSFTEFDPGLVKALVSAIQAGAH